jgi:CheY-like chemotaxis protein
LQFGYCRKALKGTKLGLMVNGFSLALLGPLMLQNTQATSRLGVKFCRRREKCSHKASTRHRGTAGRAGTEDVNAAAAGTWEWRPGWFKDCSQHGMKQRILVVDDERQVRELLCFYLAKQGYEVSSAGSSTETIQFLDTQPVELVVLDIGLADEDGLGLLARVKAQYPRTKVIMLTGMGFVEDLLEEAQQKGADGYVSKVLPLDELLIAVQRALGSGQPELATKPG